MLQGVVAHLIRKRLFARQYVFPLSVGIHHGKRRLIVVKIADDRRDRLNAEFLTNRHSAVTGEHLKAVSLRAEQHRFEHAIQCNARFEFSHCRICFDTEWMILKGLDPFQRNRCYGFLYRFILVGFARLGFRHCELFLFRWDRCNGFFCCCKCCLFVR